MKNFFKYAMLLIVVIMSGVVVSSCGEDDGESGSQGSIYGTWKANVGDDGENAVCTIKITKNSMDIKWVEDNGDYEEEVYDTFNYDESECKITAHRCKEIFHSKGETEEYAEDKVKTYYVTWLDSKHIQIGKEPGEAISDFGTLKKQ